VPKINEQLNKIPDMLPAKDPASFQAKQRSPFGAGIIFLILAHSVYKM